MGGYAPTHIWIWLTELLACGFVLFGWGDDQVGNAGEDRFGGTTVLIQVAIKHREIFFECQLKSP